MKKRKCKNGLTLIELMVTIAAASILILTVGLIMIMAFRSWRMNNAFAELRRDSAFAFSMMTKDVREANDVTAAGNTLTLDYPTDLNRPEVFYTQNGTQLDYNDGSGTMTLIPANVSLFLPDGDDDGVLLSLVLAVADANFNIAVTNEVFVNTRN